LSWLTILNTRRRGAEAYFIHITIAPSAIILNVNTAKKAPEACRSARYASHGIPQRNDPISSNSFYGNNVISQLRSTQLAIINIPIAPQVPNFELPFKVNNQRSLAFISFAMEADCKLGKGVPFAAFS